MSYFDKITILPFLTKFKFFNFFRVLRHDLKLRIRPWRSLVLRLGIFAELSVGVECLGYIFHGGKGISFDLSVREEGKGYRGVFEVVEF